MKYQPAPNQKSLFETSPMIGFLAIDQYGNRFRIEKHPRKELLALHGRKHAAKMYRDPDARHVGYVIAGHWYEVFELHRWRGTKAA